MFSSRSLDRLKSKLPPKLLKAYQRISLGGKRVTAGYGLALILLGWMSIKSYQNAIQLATNMVQVRQTQFLVKDLSNLSEILIEADYYRKSYYLYDNAGELDRYQAAIQQIEPILVKIRRAAGDEPSQKGQMAQLNQLIEQRIVLSQQSVEQFQQSKVLPTLQDTTITKLRQNQQDLHQWIETWQAEAEQILHHQIRQLQRTLQSRMMIETAGTVFTFIILLVVYRMLYRQKQRREIAEARQRMLAHANEVNATKLEFFSIISHEFRTPLSLILGSAQLLEESIRSLVAPEKLKNLHRIEVSAKLMTQMLSDVLTIARADAGKLECSPVLIEMQGFCLNLVEDFQTLTPDSYSIRFTQSGSGTHACLDPQLVYSMLSNLLSNAIKYSPPQSIVLLALICEPAFVKFQISDQGIGISSIDQEMLYEPFQRGSNTTAITGTGLGLVVVKKCVELHQGTIEVKSQSGVGTTFTVTLPQLSAESHSC